MFCAQGVTIPRVLREIGALRERTFRQVGEGTGRVIDLDAFDLFYEHLFVWDAYTRTITGAYRLADVDALRSEGRALYTESLFDYEPAFFDRVGPTVELGRSFVRLENQGGPTLAMLWRGIGAWLVRHLEVGHLMGATSIDRRYPDAAIACMVSWLKRHRGRNEISGLLHPRLPYRGVSDTLARDLSELQTQVKRHDAEGRGLPILLRHYLNLGGKAIAFNVDPDFSFVVDALVSVDLSLVDERRLLRFMGPEGFALVRCSRRRWMEAS